MQKSLRISVILIAFGWQSALPGGMPLTLEDALTLALESNEQIEIQRRAVSIAARDVDRAWTIISPRVSVSARYERPEEAIRRDGQVLLPEETRRASLVASQPVFDGRLLSARRVGLAIEASQAYTLAHTIEQTLFDVMRSYYDVLSARQQVDIAKETRDLSEREVERAQARFRAGEARRTEVLRTEVDQARAARNLVATRSTLEMAQAELARRIGVPAHTHFALETPVPVDTDRDATPVTLFEQALTHRRDLAAAQKEIDSASEQLTVLRREGWPTLDLEYQHRFVDPESYSSRNNFWEVSLAARYEFWDGGGRRISRLQQNERILQAALRLQALEKTIQLEVQQAWLDLLTVQENLTALHKEVTLAEENYRTLSEQARVGLATSLDVSTALIALNSARTETARSAFDLQVAHKRLDLVTGQFGLDWLEIKEPGHDESFLY